MVAEYVVKRTHSPSEATILKDGKLIGEIRKNDDGLDYVLRTKMNQKNDQKVFLLTPRVDGKISPFSIAVYEGDAGKAKDKKARIGNQILKIKNNLFWHNGQVYMMKNLPEGRLSKDHLSGSRFISRLVNFPYKSDAEVDPETWERLRRYRGFQVGEMTGFGINGHKVKLDPELEDIGVPLSAASYLIYSAG
ncbi:MAG: hypothetical protein ACREBS_09315 [Nitrososphaerales archaeon]